MKTTTLVAGIILAGAAFGATSALAFGAGSDRYGPGAQASFEELDIDGNGSITLEEMKSVGISRFASADSNGDGALDQAELEARASSQVARRVAGMIARFDTDGDGVLSLEEMPKPRNPGRMFGFLDEDGSGGVSRQELAEARQTMGGFMKHRRGWFGRWGDHRDNRRGDN